MTTLHLITRNLGQAPELVRQIGQALADGDELLFLAQGIYSLAALPVSYRAPVFVLASDVAATGFLPAEDAATLVDYAGFVALGARHERCISWN